VHLSGAGSCTITASQAGNANWNPAVAVAQTFTITAQPSPPPPLHKCKVPNVLGKTLGKAKSMLRQAHCRVGTVAHAYSRLKKKGIVIGQSRRPRRVFPNGTKVGLTVSRGRRRH
jgi:beta-lactam-binding protein with PASTA domain